VTFGLLNNDRVAAQLLRLNVRLKIDVRFEGVNFANRVACWAFCTR
jgi:hypothetical protein